MSGLSSRDQIVAETTHPHDLTERFLFILFKRRVIAVVTFALVVGAITGITYLKGPSYKATTKILARHNPQQQLTLFRDLATGKPLNPLINPARNLVQMSTSRGTAEDVVKRFQLDQPKEPDEFREYVLDIIKKVAKSPITLCQVLGLVEKKDEDETRLAEAIDKLLEESQDIEVQRETEIIDLTIWESDPELACAIANAMAQMLVEKTLAISRRQASEVYDFAKEQVSRADTSLRTAEQQLTQFKLSCKISSLPEERDIVLKRLEASRSARSAALANLEGVQTTLKNVDAQIEDLKPTIVSSTVTGVNPVVTQLKGSHHELRARLASIEMEKSTANRETVGLRAQINEIEKQLSAEPETLKQNETTVLNPIREDLLQQSADATAQVAALQAQTEFWEQEVEAATAELERLAQNESEYERLMREKETQEERLRTLKSKLLELDVQRLTEQSEFDIKVVDPARIVPGAEPDWPKWPLVLVVGFVFATCLGVAIPFVFEYFTTTYDWPADVERSLGVPVLATVPILSPDVSVLKGDPKRRTIGHEASVTVNP